MLYRYFQSVLQTSRSAIDMSASTAKANAALEVGGNQTCTLLTPKSLKAVMHGDLTCLACALCRYLQSVLQISCPAMDLSAFTAVANAAVDVGSNHTYNALTPDFTVAGSPMNIFLAGFFLEDVAVAMYQGLIPNIVSRDLLIAATGESCLHPAQLYDSVLYGTRCSAGPGCREMQHVD